MVATFALLLKHWNNGSYLAEQKLTEEAKADLTEAAAAAKEMHTTATNRMLEILSDAAGVVSIDGG